MTHNEAIGNDIIRVETHFLFSLTWVETVKSSSQKKKLNVFCWMLDNFISHPESLSLYPPSSSLSLLCLKLRMKFIFISSLIARVLDSILHLREDGLFFLHFSLVSKIPCRQLKYDYIGWMTCSFVSSSPRWYNVISSFSTLFTLLWLPSLSPLHMISWIICINFSHSLLVKFFCFIFLV